MTEDRRLELECRFDGEAAGAAATPALEEGFDDPEAQNHLQRLAQLRELARRHDPAGEVPRRAYALPANRLRRPPWWLAIAAAAASLAFLLRPAPRIDNPALVVIVNHPEKSANRPAEVAVDRPPLEVELYGWANTPARAPKQAARLVLNPGSSARKRTPADEILALELANASSQPRSGFQRFAISRGSKPAPTRPVNRARSSSPDA